MEPSVSLGSSQSSGPGIPLSGIYSAAPPAPQAGQTVALQVDSQGNLLVNVAVGGGTASSVKILDSSGNPLTSTAGSLDVNITGGSSGNAAAGPTGSAVPASADYVGFNSGGNLVGVSAVNPLPISGTVAVSNFPASQVVVGNLTNNNASPIGNNVGVLPAIAVNIATPPSYNVGDQVLLTTDLSGNLYTAVTNVVTVTVTGDVFAAIQSGIGVSTLPDNNQTTVFLPDIFGAPARLLVADSVYGGAFSGTANAALQGWSNRRAPTVFKTVQATASGNTAVWTPGTGNKFRLLKLFVEVTDNASLASGAVLTINFQDATTSINISFDVFVPTTSVTTVIGDGLEQELDLGDLGILSAAANNVLNVNLSVALATGNCRVIAMGTEE